MSEFEDVWLDMLEKYAKTKRIDDEDLPQFLQHAIDMMKHFRDLVTESQNLDGLHLELILDFANQLFDDRLFAALVNDIRAKTRHINLFYLIFEVCEYKVRFYEQLKKQITDCDRNTNTTAVFERLDKHIQTVTNLSYYYQYLMYTEFKSNTEFINMCRQVSEGWRTTLNYNPRSE